MTDSPFSNAAIREAIGAALAQAAVLPSDKRGALIITATTAGVQGIFAVKVGEHWQFDGTAEWHGGSVSAGVSVIASW